MPPKKQIRNSSSLKGNSSSISSTRSTVGKLNSSLGNRNISTLNENLSPSLQRRPSLVGGLVDSLLNFVGLSSSNSLTGGSSLKSSDTSASDSQQSISSSASPRSRAILESSAPSSRRKGISTSPRASEVSGSTPSSNPLDLSEISNISGSPLFISAVGRDSLVSLPSPSHRSTSSTYNKVSGGPSARRVREIRERVEDQLLSISSALAKGEDVLLAPVRQSVPLRKDARMQTPDRLGAVQVEMRPSPSFVHSPTTGTPSGHFVSPLAASSPQARSPSPIGLSPVHSGPHVEEKKESENLLRRSILKPSRFQQGVFRSQLVHANGDSAQPRRDSSVEVESVPEAPVDISVVSSSNLKGFLDEDELEHQVRLRNSVAQRRRSLVRMSLTSLYKNDDFVEATDDEADAAKNTEPLTAVNALLSSPFRSQSSAPPGLSSPALEVTEVTVSESSSTDNNKENLTAVDAAASTSARASEEEEELNASASDETVTVDGEENVDIEFGEQVPQKKYGAKKQPRHASRRIQAPISRKRVVEKRERVERGSDTEETLDINDEERNKVIKKRKKMAVRVLPQSSASSTEPGPVRRPKSKRQQPTLIPSTQVEATTTTTARVESDADFAEIARYREMEIRYLQYLSSPSSYLRMNPLTNTPEVDTEALRNAAVDLKSIDQSKLTPVAEVRASLQLAKRLHGRRGLVAARNRMLDERFGISNASLAATSNISPSSIVGELSKAVLRSSRPTNTQAEPDTEAQTRALNTLMETPLPVLLEGLRLTKGSSRQSAAPSATSSTLGTVLATAPTSAGPHPSVFLKRNAPAEVLSDAFIRSIGGPIPKPLNAAAAMRGAGKRLTVQYYAERGLPMPREIGPRSAPSAWGEFYASKAAGPLEIFKEDAVIVAKALHAVCSATGIPESAALLPVVLRLNQHLEEAAGSETKESNAANSASAEASTAGTVNDLIPSPPLSLILGEFDALCGQLAHLQLLHLDPRLLPLHRAVARPDNWRSLFSSSLSNDQFLIECRLQLQELRQKRAALLLHHLRCLRSPSLLQAHDRLPLLPYDRSVSALGKSELLNKHLSYRSLLEPSQFLPDSSGAVSAGKRRSRQADTSASSLVQTGPYCRLVDDPPGDPVKANRNNSQFFFFPLKLSSFESSQPSPRTPQKEVICSSVIQSRTVREHLMVSEAPLLFLDAATALLWPRSLLRPASSAHGHLSAPLDTTNAPQVPTFEDALSDCVVLVSASILQVSLDGSKSRVLPVSRLLLRSKLLSSARFIDVLAMGLSGPGSLISGKDIRVLGKVSVDLEPIYSSIPHDIGYISARMHQYNTTVEQGWKDIPFSA